MLEVDSVLKKSFGKEPATFFNENAFKFRHLFFIFNKKNNE